MDAQHLQRAIEELIRAVGANVDDDHPAFVAVVVPLTDSPRGRRNIQTVDVQPSPAATLQDRPELLNVKEVATALQCSPGYVKRLIATEKLASVKIGSLRRVRRADLNNYIDSLT